MPESGPAVIVGVGMGLGAALCRRFAAGGHPIVMAARNGDKLAPLVDEIQTGGGRAIAASMDAAEPAAMAKLFDDAEAAFGPVDIAIFNCGGVVRASILELDPAAFEASWRSLCLGGMLMGQEAAKRMVPRGAGAMLFTGGRGSIRAEANLATFAAGKHGLRAVAHSIARELWPRNIHVAHVVIGGSIDSEAARKRDPDRAGSDGLVSTDAVAELYFQTSRQQRSAWSLEVELRPWNEPF